MSKNETVNTGNTLVFLKLIARALREIVNELNRRRITLNAVIGDYLAEKVPDANRRKQFNQELNDIVYGQTEGLPVNPIILCILEVLEEQAGNMLNLSLVDLKMELGGRLSCLKAQPNAED